MNKGISLAVLVALLPFAASAQDVPVLENDRPVTLKVELGTLSVDGYDIRVGPGIYLNEPAAVSLSQGIEALKAENKSLKASIEEHKGLPAWILIVGGAVLVGVGVGVGVAIKN